MKKELPKSLIFNFLKSSRLKTSTTFLFAIFLFFNACQSAKTGVAAGKNPLPKILASRPADLDSILRQPEKFEVQIIYTQIDRDAANQPHFKTWYWGVDSTRYFYPASTVKMPLAFLALEKINELRREPRLQNFSKNTFYKIDSAQAGQRTLVADPTAPQGKPSIAHDIRQIFAVSDNQAYNHLFEFLGRSEINQKLRAKGYLRTGIVHRFDSPGRDHRLASPMVFFDEKGHRLHFKPALFDPNDWQNPQHSTQKGIGWWDNRDSLQHGKFDFSKKNWFALTDAERMLRSVIFPENTPASQRFDLTDEDYKFLWKYMGGFPRECDYPKYDPNEYPDGYVKLLLWGDSKTRQSGQIRSLNKVGEAYGYLIDVAYVVDFQHRTEFVLAAVIHCNSDGIYNDGKYDYEKTGLPFLAKLGQAVYDFDLRRKRKHRPDLSRFEFPLD